MVIGYTHLIHVVGDVHTHGIKTLSVIEYCKVNRLRLGGGSVSDNPVDNSAVVTYIFPFSSSDIGITHILVNCVIVIFVNELLQYRVDNSTSKNISIIVDFKILDKGRVKK